MRRDFRLIAAYLVILLACVCWCLAGPFYKHPLVSTVSLLAAGCAWWYSASRSDAGPAVGARLGWIVAGALVLRAVGLLSHAELSDDVHRYVWEGELVRRGISPYQYAPAADELEPVREQLAYTFAHMNNTDVSAAYPPLAQGVFAGVSLALHPWLELGAPDGEPSPYERGSAWALRLLFTLADLALLVPLTHWARASGRGCAGVAAWAWCPLVVVEYAGTGHFDSLALVLWWSAVIGLSLSRSRRFSFQLAWVGAVLVKYVPLASLPWILRGPRAWLRAGVLLLLALVAFLPFVGMADWKLAGLGEGLGQYGLRWESQSLTYRFVESSLGGVLERDGTLLDVRRVARGLIAGLWLAYAVWSFRRHGDDVAGSAGRLTGAFLILTPTLHPWYVTWIVPYLTRAPSPAWCYLCVVAPLFYWPLPGWVERGEWVEPAWLWPSVALPFFVLLTLPALRRIRSRS